MAWIPLVMAAVSSYASSQSGKKAAEGMAESQTEASQRAIEEQRRQFDLTRNDFAPYTSVGQSAISRLGDLFSLDRIGPQAPSMPDREAFSTHSSGPGKTWLDPFGLFKGQKNPGDPFGLVKGKKGQQDTFDEAGYNQAMAQYQKDLEKYNQDLATFNARPKGVSLFEADPGYQFRQDETLKALQRSQAAKGVLGNPSAAREITRYSSDVANQGFGDYVNRLLAISGMGQTSTTSQANLGQNNTNNISNLLVGMGNAQGQARASSYDALNKGIQGGLSNYMFWNQTRQPTGMTNTPRTGTGQVYPWNDTLGGMY